ncbi:hypothetical protein KKD03_00055 [Patescibacteria group bacterium]|nr:hypothetical protein [Patescibacteria group bacterium]
MKLKELQNTISTSVFFTHQVQKIFSGEKPSQINISLSRMAKRGDLLRIKKGLFQFPGREVDEFTLSGLIYRPSYVSLESALHVYGMIPEEVMQVTAVTPTTTKQFRVVVGGFLYSKIQQELFFGFDKIADNHNISSYYNIAKPEKALLDYIYIRQVRDLSQARVDWIDVDYKLLKQFSREFPAWVQDTIKEKI